MKFSPVKLSALVEADARLSKDIARDAGFSAGSLSHWTRGKRVPGADELAALARVFDVPLDHFFDKPGPRASRRKPPVLRESLPGKVLDRALAETDALLERAHSLKAALQKLKSGASSNKAVERAGAEAVSIARDFADQLRRRSR